MNDGRPRRRRQFEAALDHLDAVFRFSVYLTGNDVDAEDLSQDAFLQAYRKFHLFRQGTDLKAWLFRITRNLYIDRLRRQKLAPQLADLNQAAIEGNQPAAAELGPAQPMWRDARDGSVSAVQLSAADEEHLYERFGDEVKRFLAELPATFRLALLLCDVEELSYEEIAAALECPIGTVRSRISRAREHLREKLYDYARELGFTRGTKERS